MPKQVCACRPDYDKWVPKIGRRFVKPEDICFVDEMRYPPRSQTEPPFLLTVESSLPLLGDRVAARSPFLGLARAGMRTTDLTQPHAMNSSGANAAAGEHQRSEFLVRG